MTDKISSTAARVASMADDAYGHLGGMPRAQRMVELLEQLWPECYQSEHGNGVIMPPADAAKLEALYTLFGVPLKVSENSLAVLGRAYDVFCLGLGTYVSHKLRFPEQFGACPSFREYLEDWPEDWVSYVEAVAREDFSEARRLAVKLQVLSPDCKYPARVHVPAAPRPA